MSQFRVGSVPFLNAKPLVWGLERVGVEVEALWPSLLPAKLESGECDAVLVSSIDALRNPNRAIADGCSISSRRAVRSVRLFSRVPFDRVETLALDQSSLTSNALAQIVLSEMFGNQPATETLPPDGAKMAQAADAFVLIGDKGLLFDGGGLFQLDLGEAWFDMTGLPFVWACWVAGPSLSPALVERLNVAREIGQAEIALIAADAGPDVSPRLAHDYLTNVFDYGWGEQQSLALRRFGEKLEEHGVLAEAYSPTRVSARVESQPGVGM